MKRKAALGLLISALCLYLALRGIDWRAALMALRGAHYLYVIPNALLVLFGLWLRALRWRYMTDSIKPGIPIHSLFASTMIGFMVNNILPLRLGEIARPFSLSRKEQLSRSAAFATVVLERVIDAFSLFLVSGLLVAFVPFLINDNATLSRAVYMLLGAHIGVLGLLVLLRLKTRVAMAVAEKITRIFPARFQRRILEVIEKFVSGLGVFHDWRGLAKILIWSLLIWVVVGFSNYFIFLAFDLSVPWFAPYVLLVVVSLGVMLPSSPAFVGPFQFATVLALGLFGIGREVSIPFSLVLHIGNFVPVTLLGLYYLRREHFTLRQIEEEVA